MAFKIPNEADASNANQAEPDSVDFDILAAGYSDTGVVSGCAVTAQGSPDMTVAVAVGAVTTGGTHINVNAGNVTIGTAHGSLDRIDLITVSNVGTKTCTAGTAAAEPVFPSIPAGSVVLAAVYVPANDTTIASSQIVDKRVVITRKYHINTQSGTSYTVSARDIGGLIRFTGTSAITLSLPDSGTEPSMTAGAWGLYCSTAGSSTVTATGGTVTVQGSGGANVEGGGSGGNATIKHNGFGMWVYFDIDAYVAFSLDGFPVSARLLANNQTGTSYTLVMADMAKVVECNNAAAISLQIPTNASVAFPVGAVINAYQMGAGRITVSAVTPGTTTVRSPNGAKSGGQYSVLSMWKRATDEWVVYGDTVP